jgi:catechol 2,3-dioxygenase-like lactoylglutathione lyase family enzyme
MKVALDHVGFITDGIDTFEKFWCEVLGYKCIHESHMPAEMASELFNIHSPAEIRRYSHPDISPDVEIHVFGQWPSIASQNFNRFGLNHICLHTGGPGSRQEFLDGLPKSDLVELRVYDNPKGWQNIFLRDGEGNWLELREDLD